MVSLLELHHHHPLHEQRAFMACLVGASGLGWEGKEFGPIGRLVIIVI